MDNNTLSEIKKICYEEGYKSGTRAAREQLCAELIDMFKDIPMWGTAACCKIEKLKEKYNIGEAQR